MSDLNDWSVSFHTWGGTEKYDKAEMQAADKEQQIEVMRSWFTANYENPYDAGRPIDEGEVIWFYGGPFVPEEELKEKFEGIVPDDIIEELASELSEEAHEWDGNEDDYLYLYDEPENNTQYFDTFETHISDIKRLLTISLSPNVEETFYQMLYAQLFTTMETYLSDAFTTLVLLNPKYLRKYVASNPDFAKQDVRLSQIYEILDGIEERVKKELYSVMWHNLPKVIAMFNDTFGINPGNSYGELFRAIQIRHDIVHRHGKNKDGDKVDIKKQDVESLLRVLVKFVNAIEDSLNKIEGLVKPKTVSVRVTFNVSS